MLTGYLFCFAVVVVTANPVFQRIPVQLSQSCPAQTCPAQTFPATFTAACPTQTCSNQIRPTQCQTCQNNALQNVFSSIPVVVRQPNNNCPCNKPVTIQNAMTNPPVNQEALNQLVLSKILSPQLQMLLNPSAKACNQCESQTPAGVVPNIINNYIIIPPEYFKANGTNADNDDDIVKQRNPSRRRKQNRKMASSNDFKLLDNHQNWEETGNSKANYHINDGELNGQHHRSKKRGRERKSDIDITECPFDEKQEQELDPCDEKSGSKLSTSSEITKGTVKEENAMLQHYLKKVNENIEKSPNFIKNSEGNIESDVFGLSRIRKNNSERLRNVEEAIIKDFCAKNPTIPEEIARSLLMNVKRQVQSRDHSYYYPNPYLPYGYGQYFPQMFNPGYLFSDKTQRGPSKRRQRRPKQNQSGRRNKNKNEDAQDNKEPCDHCEKTVEINPTVLDIKTETTTTEKIITTTENQVKEQLPKIVSETQIENKMNLVDRLEQIKDKFAKLNEIETTTVNYNRHFQKFPELGKEEKVPTFYDNGVEDYYPDFKADSIAFYASDEELNRYHYTTDRNGVNGGKRNDQRYVNPKNHNSIKYQNSESKENPNLDEAYSEYALPISVDERDESSVESVNDKSAKVRFRIPPSLELPDFKTKQINKYYASEEINDKFVADDSHKISAYSDAKIDSRALENDLKPVKVFSKDKKGRTNVETVFGHSRVVKYGHDVEAAGSTPAITYYLPDEAMTEDRIQLPDGDNAVVFAKSIRDLEEIWE